MNYYYLILLLFYSISFFGQNSEFKELKRFESLNQSLIQSDWKLINGKDSMEYSFSLINHNNYSLTNDSIMDLDLCYIHFAYKITLVNKDSLILKPIDLIYKPVLKRELKELIFLRDSCTGENNQYNNKKYLSFKHNGYKVLIEDSLGVNAAILNEKYQKVILTEKNQNELDNFILNNRHNDTHMELFIFETLDGRFGVVSINEKIEIGPYYKSIKIEYDNIVRNKNNLYSVPIICLDFQGNKSVHSYYF